MIGSHGAELTVVDLNHHHRFVAGDIKSLRSVVAAGAAVGSDTRFGRDSGFANANAVRGKDRVSMDQRVITAEVQADYRSRSFHPGSFMRPSSSSFVLLSLTLIAAVPS